MNNDCINIFNESIRNELFFCWAGIVATLVVFVAEAIKDNENILSKKLILKKSKIREAIISIIIIILLLWITSIISENRIYRILQLIISIVLLLLFVLTIKYFSELIKILIDKDYYSSETVKYAEKISNKYNNQSDTLNNNCKEVNKNIIQLYRNKNGDYDIDLIKEYLSYLYDIKNIKSYEHFYTQIENEYLKNRKENNESNDKTKCEIICNLDMYVEIDE